MDWRRGQAYSQHLRDRVLAAVDRGMAVYAAAPMFLVSVSWIYKVLARRRHTGDLTLAELRAWLWDEHQVSISQCGMWKTLRALGLTRARGGADACRCCRGTARVARHSADTEPGAAGLH